MPAQTIYLPLLNDRDGESPDSTADVDHLLASKRTFKAELQEKRAYRFMIWTCMGCLACTVMNIIVLGYWKAALAASSKPKQLEFVSTYIGLDTAVYDPASPPWPDIKNFPLALAQINSSQPDLVGYDTHSRVTYSGVIYPNDRRFLLLPSVSTIAQYRAGDFGMERCTLTGSIPSLDALNNTNRTVAMSGTRTHIHIWRLQSNEKVDVRTLSWSNRPRRESLFAELNAFPGESFTSDKFHCPSGSLHTFEFACIIPGCYLEFHQDPGYTDLGFMLKQQQSIRA